MAGQTKYEIKLMNVPFNNSYKHIVLFDSISDQEEAFTALAQSSGKEYEDLNVIVKNGSFILKGKWDTFNNYNYMMYRYKDTGYPQNNHISKWFYAFILDVQYNSRIGTVISHTLDVWQTYHIGAKFNKAFIERGHIAKDDDVIGRWIAPEPIGFGADFETEQDIFSNLNFTPQVCIESLSLPILHDKTFAVYKPSGAHPSETIHMSRFEYGGVGTGSNITGYYRIFPSSSYLKNILSLWQYPEYTTIIDEMDWNSYQNFKQSNNHISDIISFSILPQFIFGTSSPTTINISGIDNSGNNVTVGSYLNSSTVQHEPSTVSIDNTQLGCVNENGTHYVPNNNKMYTSLARAFKVFNKNGLSIPMRPELFDDIANQNSLTLEIYMHTYGNEIKLELKNYNDLDVNYLNIPYAYSFNYGLNNNVGVAQDTRISAYNTARSIATLKYVQKGIGIAAELGLGAAGLGSGIGSVLAGSALQQSVSQKILNQFPNATVPTEVGVTNPMRAAAGVGGIAKGVTDTVGLIADIKGTEFDLAIERANAYTSQSVNIGNVVGDRLDVTSDFVKLRFAECNPTYYECQIIDKFLDVYGYSIMRWYDLEAFLTHRKKWNYIKTKDCNIELDAPNNDIVTMNNIFNAGTTVWRKLSYVGNYNQTNN